jgi:hypothetical protein
MNANLLVTNALSTSKKIIEITNPIVDRNDTMINDDDEDAVNGGDSCSNEEKIFCFKAYE